MRLLPRMYEGRLVVTKPNSISKIELRGFQTHRDFALDVGPGVTTIIGPSDVGKSAVLRAIKWLALNEPSGDSFIRWGNENARVRMTLSDGAVFRRTKGKAGNSYRRGDRKYVAFGNSVPPEIETALKIGAENFQGQYDTPFWIGETAGEISRQLNRVVNLGVIDHVLKELTTGLRRVTTEVDVVGGQLEECLERKECWEFSHKMDEDLSQVEVCERQRAKVAEKILALAEAKMAGLLAQQDIRHSEEPLAEGAAVLKVAAEWNACQDEANVLRRLVEQARKQTEVLKRPIPDLGDLEKLRVLARRAGAGAETLGAFLWSAKGAEEECAELDSLVSQSEIKLRKEMGDVCLLCNQPIKS